MICKSCGSENRRRFSAEINIHFTGGIQAIDKPTVWVFPQLSVCLNCGFAEFSIEKCELQQLAEESAEASDPECRAQIAIEPPSRLPA
jgi:hypothetical protein